MALAEGFDDAREHERNERHSLYPFVVWRGVGIHITRAPHGSVLFGFPTFSYSWRFQYRGRVYSATLAYRTHTAALDAALAETARLTRPGGL